MLLWEDPRLAWEHCGRIRPQRVIGPVLVGVLQRMRALQQPGLCPCWLFRELLDHVNPLLDDRKELRVKKAHCVVVRPIALALAREESGRSGRLSPSVGLVGT